MAGRSDLGKLRISVGLAAAASLLITTTAIGALVRTDGKKLPTEAAAAIAAAATTSTTAPPRDLNPIEVALPALSAGSLGPNSSGPELQAYEQRLADVRFDVGNVDGTWDGQTTYAVQGFQKLMGLPITGVITVSEQAALQSFKWPEPIVPNAEPDRVEVDIPRQVLILWKANKIALISTVSSGSGARFCYIPKKGNTNVRVCTEARTPSGRYQFYLFKKGWDDGDLGRLYNPWYFNGGIAIHGYPQVPTTAASHGCVRIPMQTAEYFYTMVTKGMPVYVVGGPEGEPVHTYTPIATAAPPASSEPVVAPNTTEVTTTTSPTTTLPPSSSTPTTAP